MIRFRKSLWWATLLVVLLGVGASSYLTYEHFLHVRTAVMGKSLCNINNYLNCDLVLTSRYATLGPFPLAGLGLTFYLYLLGAVLYSRMAQDSLAEVLALPWLMVSFAVALSAFLAYVSFTRLHALCAFCASLYVVNILLFFLLWTQAGQGGAMQVWNSLSKGKGLIYFVFVFAFGGLMLFSTHKLFAREFSQNQVDAYLRQVFAQHPVTIDIEGRPYWGNPDAKIVVVEFSDIECPVCRLAAFNLKPILNDYKDKVKLVFMNYPLDKSCNPQMPRELHQQACQAAYAAHCAAAQGKFWDFSDEAFQKQPNLSPESLEKIAKKLQLNMDAFNVCRASEDTKAFVAHDLAEGAKVKIEGTPTVFINGYMFPNWISGQLVHGALDRLLAGQK